MYDLEKKYLDLLEEQSEDISILDYHTFQCFDSDSNNTEPEYQFISKHTHNKETLVLWTEDLSEYKLIKVKPFNKFLQIGQNNLRLQRIERDDTDMAISEKVYIYDISDRDNVK